MPLPPQAQKFVEDFDKKLHEPGKITDFLGTLEAKTGVKRLHIAGGLFSFTVVKNVAMIRNFLQAFSLFMLFTWSSADLLNYSVISLDSFIPHTSRMFQI